MLTVGLVRLLMLVFATPLTQATPTPAGVTAIPPVVWELVEITGATPDPVEIAEPERYTVQFQPDGKLAVTADCNQATGTYTAGDDVLDATITVSTLALCPLGSRNEPFLSLLDSATTFEFNMDGLLNLAGEEGRLRLRAALTGVRWEWQSFRGGDDAFSAPDRPEEFTITFSPDGKIVIQADCKRATGIYVADGSTLELTADRVTRAKCSPGSLGDQYLRDLNDVSSHVFRDGRLYLALWADAGILEFAARFGDPPVATPDAG